MNNSTVTKRVFTTLIGLFLLSGNISAKEPTKENGWLDKRNELTVGIGTMFNAYDINCDPDEYIHISPIISTSYMRHISKVWSVGATLCYFHANSREVLYDIYTGETCSCQDQKDNVILIMGNAKARWCRRKMWNMYSRFAFGFTTNQDVDESNNKTKMYIGPSFQITPIAVEVGNDKLRGFLELGGGLEGFLKVGVSHRF